MACARSHIKAVEAVRDAGKNGADPDSLWLVFEDDVELSPDYPKKIKDFINKMPCNLDWDILNTWLMPPRKMVNSLSEHFGVPDGYWGMQGYVVTPKTAEKLLKCIGKVWAQVDEMIGCCAAAPPAEFGRKGETHCVYNTVIPTSVPLDLHPYVVQPNLLKHKPFKSTAHLRTGVERFGIPNYAPFKIPETQTGYVQEVKDKIKNIEQNIKAEMNHPQ